MLPESFIEKFLKLAVRGPPKLVDRRGARLDGSLDGNRARLHGCPL